MVLWQERCFLMEKTTVDTDYFDQYGIDAESQLHRYGTLLVVGTVLLQ